MRQQHGAAGLEERKNVPGSKCLTRCGAVLSKDYYELVPANVRAPVKPALLDRVCMLFSSLPKLGTFVQGKAVDVTKDAVLLEGGKSVSYDHLVIATGSSYPEPSLKGGTSLQEKKRLLKVRSARSLASPLPCFLSPHLRFLPHTLLPVPKHCVLSHKPLLLLLS